MSTRKKLWLIPALLYGLFVFWYTDFGGPMDDAEIAELLAVMASNGSSVEGMELVRQFAQGDTGRQFFMVNAIDFNENPPAVEGVAPNETARQLMARYMEYMFPAMLKRASHPVLMGDAVHTTIDVLGIEGAENWDSAVVMRYRSRRTLFEIVSNPAFGGRHDFKLAALDKTIAYPIEPGLYLGDPRLLLGLIFLAATALIDLLRLSKQKG